MEDDPLLRLKDFAISSGHIVVRTVEVEKGNRQYRIEVIRYLGNPTIPFDVRCYRLENIGGADAVDERLAWVLWPDFASAQEPTIERALTYALSELPR